MESDEPDFDKSKSNYPAPPVGRRHFTLIGLILLTFFSWSVCAALMSDARYSVTNPVVVELGPLADAHLDGDAEWISGTGHPEEKALSFQRRGESGSFLLAPIAERPELLVALRVPESLGKGQKYLPPRRLTGRLMKLTEAGLSERSILQVIESADFPTAQPQYLLLQGESPASKRDSLWAAVLLAVLGLVSLLSAARLFLALGRKEPSPAV